ncbi:MAG: tRNA threonylcarbamoyladenosine dehydratase [Bacteroidales bacterium]|nr:tRNA threonylcarbamoyladenosine dehydratase [Bacteroidales bacterium]
MLGKEGLDSLKKANILIVGLGGVGAYAAEMLCRAGVGKLTIIDGDTINPSNLNRQLIALSSTIGNKKAETLSKRLWDINPEIKLNVIDEYIRDERMIEILKQDKYDFVVDAIDTLSPKIFLILHCLNLNIPIVSSMGSGGKLDPTQIRIDDISQSYNCPLASKVRKKIHKFGYYEGFAVVYSPEEVSPEVVKLEEGTNKKSAVGTISYMPPIFGCMCASVVIRKLIGVEIYPEVKDKRYYANKKEKQDICLK